MRDCRIPPSAGTVRSGSSAGLARLGLPFAGNILRTLDVVQMHPWLSGVVLDSKGDSAISNHVLGQTCSNAWKSAQWDYIKLRSTYTL